MKTKSTIELNERRLDRIAKRQDKARWEQLKQDTWTAQGNALRVAAGYPTK